MLKLADKVSLFLLNTFMIKPCEFIMNIISKLFLPLMTLLFIGFIAVDIIAIIFIIIILYLNLK